MTRAACVAAIVVVLAGCDRRAGTEDNVREALDQANITSVDVAVEPDEKIVHLSGTVETLAERTRAEEIAEATVGTTGRVINEVTVETLEQTPETPDQRIQSTLDRLIDEDPVMRARDVNITVSDAVVSITGEVRTTQEKNRVSEIARGAPGVKDVINRLQVTAAE